MPSRRTAQIVVPLIIRFLPPWQGERRQRGQRALRQFFIALPLALHALAKRFEQAEFAFMGWKCALGVRT